MKHARKGIHPGFDATKIVLPIASKKIDVNQKSGKKTQKHFKVDIENVWNTCEASCYETWTEEYLNLWVWKWFFCQGDSRSFCDISASNFFRNGCQNDDTDKWSDWNLLFPLLALFGNLAVISSKIYSHWPQQCVHNNAHPVIAKTHFPIMPSNALGMNWL